MSGKGSGRRPAQVSEEQQQASWDLLFPRKPKLTEADNPVKEPDDYVSNTTSGKRMDSSTNSAS